MQEAKMLKRVLIITLALGILMIFSGCYTVFASRKVSKDDWRNKHSYLYFSKTTWGKEWNNYYWSPSSNPLFGSSKDSKSKKSNSTYRDRYDPNPECILADCCLEGIWDAIFGNDNDDDDDNGDNPTDEPTRRRGMSMSMNSLNDEQY